MWVIPLSLGQYRIERERGLAEDPILIGRLGKGERLARGGENLGERADRIRKIRAPGDPGSAERIDELAEERVRRAPAPALGRYIDGRDLEIDLLVFGKLEEFGRRVVGRAIRERHARQVIEDDRDFGEAVHDLAQQRQAFLLHLYADRNVLRRRMLPERIG